MIRIDFVSAVFAIFAILLVNPKAYALDSSDVLPEGVRSLGVKIGEITGLDEEYTDSGSLEYLSDINSTELDASTLKNIAPDVSNLVNVLNNFGNHSLGNQIDLGKLYVNSDPTISYFAPLFLYGYNSRLTLGVAVPIIHYSNQVGVSNTGSNLQQLQDLYKGIPEIESAINQLNVDMKTEFQQALISRGYKPLADVNTTFIGDIQLVGIYKIPQTENTTSALRVLFGLPTGPKADPDDLTSLKLFGHTSVQPVWITTHTLTAKSYLVGSLSFQAMLPEHDTVRVPSSPTDDLPDASEKMGVTEYPGDTWSATAGYAYKLDQRWTSSIAYKYEQKFMDTYSGIPDGRAQYLEADTNTEAQMAKLNLTYSTVDAYKNKNATIPGSISYEISQVVSGVNVENQMTQEIWLSLYF